mgnify:CR=1 FL=1
MCDTSNSILQSLFWHFRSSAFHSVHLISSHPVSLDLQSPLLELLLAHQSTLAIFTYNPTYTGDVDPVLLLPFAKLCEDMGINFLVERGQEYDYENNVIRAPRRALLAVDESLAKIREVGRFVQQRVEGLERSRDGVGARELLVWAEGPRMLECGVEGLVEWEWRRSWNRFEGGGTCSLCSTSK